MKFEILLKRIEYSTTWTKPLIGTCNVIFLNEDNNF